MVEIRNNDEYKRALHRMDELRGKGKEEEQNPELAELQAAVSAYSQQSGKPATSPGRPPSRAERTGKSGEG